MYFLESWEPLPDRTVALNFGDVSFRHTILAHKAVSRCKGVTVNADETITLLTHIGNNAFEYTLKGEPDFYKIGSNDWEWIGERTGTAYGKRK